MEMVENVVEFDKFTKPMQDTLLAERVTRGFVVSSAHPAAWWTASRAKIRDIFRCVRMYPGMRDRYVAEVGARLFRTALRSCRRFRTPS